MLQKFIKIKFIIAVCLTFLSFVPNVFAQSGQWLDMKPLPSWNARKRVILQTKKISPAELRRCAQTVRPPTLPQDFLLTGKGWTLTGAAHVFGKTTLVTTAGSFDGMCRPMDYETYVFVGNRVAGTLTPGPVDSRTDGSIFNIELYREDEFSADFSRYGEDSALCCPSSTERVTYKIKPDGRNFLVVPEGKFELSSTKPDKPDNGGDSKGSLKGGVWRWVETQTPVETIKVDRPENYTIQFVDDKSVQVLADCNRGRGAYTASGGGLTFGPIATTRRACLGNSLDSRFLSQLAAARIYFFRGGDLYLDLMADGGTMRFTRSGGNGGGGNSANLENTSWRWQRADGPKGNLTIDKPQNYRVEFKPNGELGMKADCNGGGGNYKVEGNRLTISSLIRTQMFCGERSHDTRFVEGLEKARNFRVEGDMLIIESAGDTLRFSRATGRN